MHRQNTVLTVGVYNWRLHKLRLFHHRLLPQDVISAASQTLSILLEVGVAIYPYHLWLVLTVGTVNL
jgi:hypothetical protein